MGTCSVNLLIYSEMMGMCCKQALGMIVDMQPPNEYDKTDAPSNYPTIVTPNQGVLQSVETHSCKLVYKAIKHSWLTINPSEQLVNLVNRLAGDAPHGASATFGTAAKKGRMWTGRWGFNPVKH